MVLLASRQTQSIDKAYTLLQSADDVLYFVFLALQSLIMAKILIRIGIPEPHVVVILIALIATNQVLQALLENKTKTLVEALGRRVSATLSFALRGTSCLLLAGLIFLTPSSMALTLWVLAAVQVLLFVSEVLLPGPLESWLDNVVRARQASRRKRLKNLAFVHLLHSLLFIGSAPAALLFALVLGSRGNEVVLAFMILLFTAVGLFNFWQILPKSNPMRPAVPTSENEGHSWPAKA